jgi:hypothetical protein
LSSICLLMIWWFASKSDCCCKLWVIVQFILFHNSLFWKSINHSIILTMLTT